MKEKKLYLEILRIIAIILVIFNHTDVYYSYYSNTNNIFTYIFSLVLSVVCRINVPIFLMVAGAVLIGKTESLLSLFKRIFRIILVGICFSLLYYVIEGIRNPANIFSIHVFVRGLLSGTIQESFWYLYLYCGVLLILPFLRKAIYLSNNEFCYMLISQTILLVGSSFLTEVAGISINGELNLLNISFFYVLSGYYLGNKLDEKVIRKNIVKIVLVSLSAIVASCALVVFNYKQAGYYRPEMLTIFTPILAQCIFVIVRWAVYKYALCMRTEKMICYIGGCTFGIYLLEQLARIQLLSFYLYLCDIAFGVFACTCYVLGSFILALIYSIILKKVPGLRKLL